MNKKIMNGVVVLIGIILLLAGLIYFLEPAKSLPSFMPGYDAALTKHHYTHAFGALILGLLCFTFVWFKAGKKSTNEKK